MEQQKRLERFLQPVFLRERETIMRVEFWNCNPELQLIPLTIIVPEIPALLSVTDQSSGRMLYFSQVDQTQNVIEIAPGKMIRIYWGPVV